MARADFALLCEDVRREINGKHILIGVFSGDVVAEQLPLNMQAVFWVSLADLVPGNLSIEMQVHDGKGTTFGTVSVKLVINDPPPHSAPFATPPVPVAYGAPGELCLSVRIDKGEWIDLLTKRVIQNPKVAEQFARAST